MQEKTFSQVFAERLRLLREAQGFSQQNMADALNVCRSTYTRYENASSSPSLELTQRIARILQADIRYLFQISPNVGGAALSDNLSDSESLPVATLPEEEKRLLQYYRTLTPEQQKQLFDMIIAQTVEQLPSEPKFSEE